MCLSTNPSACEGDNLPKHIPQEVAPKHYDKKINTFRLLTLFNNNTQLFMFYWISLKCIKLF